MVLSGGSVAAVILVFSRLVTSDPSQLAKTVQLQAHQSGVRQMCNLTVIWVLTSFAVTWTIPDVVMRIITTLTKRLHLQEMV